MSRLHAAGTSPFPYPFYHADSANSLQPPRAASYSTQLADGLVEKLVAENPGSSVTVRDLTKQLFPHLEEVHLQSFFTPAEGRSTEQQAAVRHSDEAIAELLAADTIVIGAPLYNFGIASTLKAWIDHIARAGLTFRYSAAGPEGLVKGKKVYVAMSSGGVYSEGPMAAYDFVVPYLKSVLAFLGMTDVTVVRVEGTSIPDLQETALPKALASISL
ncbi:FMN-dependent NADH-azoreductase [Hymenobacter cellulosilyticus]|uniref:FMN dependent NADH:quinone oxidoreductase n=1 Tax=Hymenobacter cellulosilyticus TaxID=2932248 RepID=A0A8T9Q9J5_9BACT|nr:NAD(P)H-dependent oxidoreductase [Hymenobacter cellulosilyticus]UOQ71603.1 NAD(P)H-dependent oxidoreductase [Hymenobacter cellulosilyticus]